MQHLNSQESSLILEHRVISVLTDYMQTCASEMTVLAHEFMYISMARTALSSSTLESISLRKRTTLSELD
jgi:hypothetical protein